mgnify:CR=1 FL=1
MTELQTHLLNWIAAALALYAAAAAVNRLVRAAAAVALALLAAGYLANPSDPTALARSVWEATREPLARIASALAGAWRILWQHALSTLAR